MLSVELVVSNEDGEDHGYITDPDYIYNCRISAIWRLDSDVLEQIRDRLIAPLLLKGIDAQAIIDDALADQFA